MIFKCPKCGGDLSSGKNGAAVCPEGHSYDRAKEGYYNLLLSKGGAHGDNADMVQARRAFLAIGAYRPLADKVAKIACRETENGGVLLDCGCGEGYYTKIVSDALTAENKCVTVAGFDISKDAVKRSAKRLPGGEFAVAGAYAIPIASASVDTAVNLFSPLAEEEMRRIIRPGGKFIYVIPGEKHLYSLKSVLYDDPYPNAPSDTALDGFTLLTQESVSYSFDLETKEQIASLFGMTPYAYRTPKEGRERLLALDRLTAEADFRILLYRKN